MKISNTTFFVTFTLAILFIFSILFFNTKEKLKEDYITGIVKNVEYENITTNIETVPFDTTTHSNTKITFEDGRTITLYGIPKNPIIINKNNKITFSKFYKFIKDSKLE